jgi:hypothetical protein
MTLPLDLIFPAASKTTGASSQISIFKVLDWITPLESSSNLKGGV